MNNLRIAKRYASALIDLAKEHNKQQAIAEELLIVKKTIECSRELRNVLVSPILPKHKKKMILQAVFGAQLSNIVMTYLDAIITKGREEILYDIVAQYFVLRDEEQGIVRVNVATSAEFTSTQEKDFQKKLETMTKKNIQITFSIDKSLKGGFVARVGDTVLDGSVKGQLETLKRTLKDGILNN